MTLRIGGMDLQIHWSFWLMLGLTAALPKHRLFLLGLAAASCHELGHLTAMAVCGCKPQCLRLTLLGGKLTDQSLARLRTEFFSVAAGPAVNLLLAGCFAFSTQYGYRLFSAMNLVLGGFNLLPIQGMDGGRLLWLAAEQHCSIRRTRRICIAAACAALFLLLLWSIWLWQKHPQLPALLFFPLVPAVAFFRWLKD